ncbi:MAG: hypothetical protein ACLQNE_33115 [Thermoguttaceae bacterium]
MNSTKRWRVHWEAVLSLKYEAEFLAERVAACQAAAHHKGKTWGGSKKGWPWKVTDQRKV